MKHKVYLSLGSNLGDRRRMIADAIEQIEEQVGTVLCRSALYDTAPWGFHSENRFVNAAVCCETELSPHGVLERTQAIERTLGRTEKSVGGQYHDRLIDIDILLYDDVCISCPDLTIPHPRMLEREFVMLPLREICDADRLYAAVRR